MINKAIKDVRNNECFNDLTLNKVNSSNSNLDIDNFIVKLKNENLLSEKISNNVDWLLMRGGWHYYPYFKPDKLCLEDVNSGNYSILFYDNFQEFIVGKLNYKSSIAIEDLHNKINEFYIKKNERIIKKINLPYYVSIKLNKNELLLISSNNSYQNDSDVRKNIDRIKNIAVSSILED